MPLMAEFIVDVSNPNRNPPSAAPAARIVTYRVLVAVVVVVLDVLDVVDDFRRGNAVISLAATADRVGVDGTVLLCHVEPSVGAELERRRIVEALAIERLLREADLRLGDAGNEQCCQQGEAEGVGETMDATVIFCRPLSSVHPVCHPFVRADDAKTLRDEEGTLSTQFS